MDDQSTPSQKDSEAEGRAAKDADEKHSKGVSFDSAAIVAGMARPSDSALTLRKVVEMVRRMMRADTASVVRFSLAERTVTWKATSGFRTIPEGDENEIVNPLQGEIAERAASSGEIMFVEALAGVLPPSELPLHSAEGVRDMALAPLRARGETLGALIVGYRASHRFTPDEKQLLEGLSEMAALALDNARLLETVSTAKKVWEQTFDAIPDGIIVHDEGMRIARCNREAAAMMGFDHPSEAIGMSCADAFAKLFGERAAAYHMKQGTGTASSFELQSEDGRRYLVSVAPLTSLNYGYTDSGTAKHSSTGGASSAAHTGGDAGLSSSAALHQSPWSVITWSDITDLSEIQEQLARSRRLATVGQLAAGVAHEINNPLAAITACAEATLRGIRSIPETARHAEDHNWNFYLEEIVRQALRCKSITRGLLDLSRQRRARREPCELNTLIERSVKSFEPRAEESGISLSLDLDSAIGEVATDETMVRQILDNLLSNALDAVGEQGKITISSALHSERIAVEVADTGHGIPPETLARIFDPFFTTKEQGKGSGLGLAISYALSEAIGGALAVESKPGSGSCFRLWLPRRAPERR